MRRYGEGTIIRILVVDDEAEVQRMREQLAPRGIEVAGASDADDAFRLWQSEGPWSLVVTELRIAPGRSLKDGMELVKAIRTANPSQRTAIHTGEEGLLAAPVPVLRKPYAMEQLLRVLRPPLLPLSPLSERQ